MKLSRNCLGLGKKSLRFLPNPRRFLSIYRPIARLEDLRALMTLGGRLQCGPSSFRPELQQLDLWIWLQERFATESTRLLPGTAFRGRRELVQSKGKLEVHK